MSPSDDRSQEPWTDPQTHLDTDPVNAPDPEVDLAGDPVEGTDEQADEQADDA
jgi:hypothetical protein